MLHSVQFLSVPVWNQCDCWGWITALFVRQVSIHFDIYSLARLQCVGQCLQIVC